jgi:hypothetical protein
LAKVLVVIIFVAIVASLGSALLFLLKDGGRSDRMARALSIRIGISIGLFALLFLLYAAGVIEPHGVRP